MKIKLIDEGIKHVCLHIVEIRGTQNFALVGDPARATAHS